MIFLLYVSLLVVLYHIVKKLFSAPKSPNGFDNIPSIPSLEFIWAMFTGKPQDEIQGIISKVSDKGIIKANAGTIAFFYLQDVEYIKQFLTKSEDVLPKMKHGLGNRVKSFYGNGILFSNSHSWRMQRKLNNAAFNRALSHDIIGKNAFKLFNLMDYNLDKPINIYDMMQRTTIEILGQVAFAYEFGGLNSFEIPDIIKSYKYVMEQTENWLHILFPIMDHLPLESNKKYQENMNVFDNFILNLIAQRRKELKYQDKEKSDTTDNNLLSSMLELGEKEGIKIDSRELRDNLVNLFIAGHDSEYSFYARRIELFLPFTLVKTLLLIFLATSLNMSVAIYHLAKFPEMQKKAREEVIRVLGNALTTPTSEQVKELKYINAVIKESLRTYPPLAILIPRQPNDYVQVGPYMIPPDSYTCVNVWHVHHDPNIWENPYQFDPERFLNGEKRHPYSFIPFSAGPRNCAGQNFSLMEQRVLLSMILLKYEWTLPEDSIHKVKFCLDSNFLLKPKDLDVEIQFKRI
ncbi:7324_t:CDS:2 [Funneliformis caledonium]|uniref:7324_t:CDS:1 n=1 Tax=Funneliformis caledonium TaxID=1117310 RepID=A0A9N8WQT1_9GLOM|nr:7324_t:CDS:2 [Funneliformis caledonium]